MTGQPYNRSRDQPSIYDGDARPAMSQAEYEAGVERIRKALEYRDGKAKSK
jgi:hypothetical protein